MNGKHEIDTKRYKCNYARYTYKKIQEIDKKYSRNRYKKIQGIDTKRYKK